MTVHVFTKYLFYSISKTSKLLISKFKKYPPILSFSDSSLSHIFTLTFQCFLSFSKLEIYCKHKFYNNPEIFCVKMEILPVYHQKITIIINSNQISDCFCKYCVLCRVRLLREHINSKKKRNEVLFNIIHTKHILSVKMFYKS